MVKYFLFWLALAFLLGLASASQFFLNPESNSVVSSGSQLCLKWRPPTEKAIDPYRGWLSFTLMNGTNQYNLAQWIDPLGFEGIKVLIPLTIPEGTYRVLAELESCVYGNLAYLSEPFRVIAGGPLAQDYGISELVRKDYPGEFGNCWEHLPDVPSWLPQQLECSEIPQLSKEEDSEACELKIKLNIRNLALGIISVEEIELDNECQLEPLEEEKKSLSLTEEQRLRSSIYCRSDSDCYPGEYCDSYKKRKESNGYWLCQN